MDMYFADNIVFIGFFSGVMGVMTVQCRGSQNKKDRTIGFMNKGYKRADIESAPTGICVLMRIIGKIIIPNSALSRMLRK